MPKIAKDYCKFKELFSKKKQKYMYYSLDILKQFVLIKRVNKINKIKNLYV